MKNRVTVITKPIFGSEEHAFIGYHDELGGVVVHKNNEATILYEMDEQEVEDLLMVAREEGGLAFDEMYEEEWGDELNSSHLEDGDVKVTVSGSHQATIPLEDHDLASLLGAVSSRMDEDNLIDGKFPAEGAVFLLPSGASDSLLEDLRRLLQEDGIPPQFARFRGDERARDLIVGEPTAFIYRNKELEDLDDDNAEPETKQTTLLNMGSALGEEPEAKVEEIDIPEGVPAGIRSAIHDGQRSGKPVLVEEPEVQAILTAILQSQMALASVIGVPMKVALPRKVGGEDFPPEVVKMLIESGIEVSTWTTQNDHVTAAIEPSS